MKKSAKLKFLSLATLVFAGVFGGAAGTVAWFTTNVHIEEANMLLTGDALGAYFEYGEGTAEKPYGIKTVRQLYNLSWLQYLGYFNPTKEDDYPYSGRWTEAMKKIHGNEFNEKPHFELAGDIDFSNKDASSIGINGMPPIGTTAFPFEGFFDGRGYTISHGVFSTNSGDFGVKPLAVTTYNADTNVGVFGKVTGAETSIKDLGISSPLVKSTQANTVIGAAIGDAGTAQYSNIAVDDPTLRIGNGTSASNLSDYGLVGKIDASQTHRVQIVDNKLSTIDVSQDTFTIPNQGGENDWGGSINMTAMFNRLNTIYNDYASVPAGTNEDPSIPLRVTDLYASDGTTLKKTTVDYTSTGDEGYDLKRYNSIGRKSGVSYNSKLGAYQMTRQGNPASENFSVMYVSGGHWNQKEKEYLHTGYKITDGTNYLQFDINQANNWINRTTNLDTATLWEFPESGTWGPIKTLYRHEAYYLNDDNGTLRVSTNPTNWEVFESDGKRYICSDKRQLVYSSGWKLASRPMLIKHVSGGNSYYLNRTNSGISTGTNAGSASTWMVDNNGYLYYTNGNYNYYMGRDGSFTTSRSSESFQINENNYLWETYESGFIWTTTYYKCLTFSNYSFAISSRNESFDSIKNKAVLTFESGTTSPSLAITSETSYEGPDSWGADLSSRMAYDDQDVTYYPLGAKETADDPNATHNEGLFEPLYQNTGYVIGGSSFNDETDSFARGYATVRVSKYRTVSGGKVTTYNTYLKNFDGTKKTFTDVKTIGSDNQIAPIDENSNSFQKYKASKPAFINILNNSGGALYGLHFTQSDIDENSLVSAIKAQINGREYDNYEMPANSIDFRLKQKGYINFFAGSYTGSRIVDSFFSLHMITRNSNNESKIDCIDEIEEIYSDFDANNIATESHSYVYKVKDKQNSTPSETVWKYTRPYRVNARGQKVEIERNEEGKDVAYLGGYLTQEDFNSLTEYYSVFNTSRIKYSESLKTNSDYQNQCFYFEIPVNQGEYCLGSVSNGSMGGYLLYLDIGANAQKDNRTQIHEKFVRITSLTAYVENFVLVESASTVMAALITTDQQGARVRKEGAADLNAADSIAFRVKAGQAGDVVIQRDSNVITLSRSGPPDTEITYAARGMTLREQTGESSYSPISLVTETTTTTTFNRLTLLDWDPANSVGTVTTITDETGKARVITQTKGGETVATPVVYKGTEYGNACGTAFKADDLATLPIAYSPASTIMEFDYIADAATEIATKFTLQESLNEGTGFYTLTGYDFDITRTGSVNFTAYVTETVGTITVVIDQQKVQYTFTYKINGTSVTTPTSVLINRVPAS